MIKTTLRFETQESPFLILIVFTAVPSMDEQSAILVLLCLWEEKKMKRKIIRIVLRENFGFFKSERKCRKELQWKSGG